MTFRCTTLNILSPQIWCVHVYDFIFRAVFRFTANCVGEWKRFPIYLLYPHMHSLPSHQNLVPEWYMCLQLMNLRWNIITKQSRWFALGFTLGHVHSMNFNKCIVTSIRHYIEQLYCPKNSVLCLFIPYFPITPDNHWPFAISMDLPFLESHVVGSLQCVAFPDLLLALSSIH